MQGSHNITLTSQNNSEYILPISGTLATTDDLLPNNSVTTSNIINGTIQGIDIANNTLDDTKIAADLSATKVTSGVINKNKLPNRDIVNINNLTTVLGGKLVKFDIAKYRRILANKKDAAIVPVVHGTNCGGCHMKLTQGSVLAAKGGKAGAACENCGRLLFWPAG